MTKPPQSPKAISATAGLSSIVLYILLESDITQTKELLAVVPVVAGIIIFIIDWFAAKFSFESASNIRAKAKITTSINELKVEIEYCKKQGLPFDKFEEKYKDMVNARSNLSQI